MRISQYWLIAGAIVAVLSAAQAQSVRQITSGTTDAVRTTSPTDLGLGKTILWDSTTSGTKTETIPACNSTTNAGNVFAIKDEIGNAFTNPIDVVPPSGTTVDNNPTSFIMGVNFQSATFQCDGVSNWVVE